jgi:hypothetical protein
MRSTVAGILRFLAFVVIVGALPAILAHGSDDGAMDMGEQGDIMDMTAKEPKPGPDSYPPTYFAHPEHVNAIYAHIGIMVIGWVFMLPIGMRPGVFS